MGGFLTTLLDEEPNKHEEFKQINKNNLGNKKIEEYINLMKKILKNILVNVAKLSIKLI